MNVRLRSLRRLGAALAITVATAVEPAAAVIILDSTWAAEGGEPGREGRGFAASIALAGEPQFAGVIGLEWNNDYGGSGTWIGNDARGRAYILTAAHNFDDGSGATGWTYVSSSGKKFSGVKLEIHPLYDKDDNATGGYDMAIVVLDGPIDDAGEQPRLYGGAEELHQIATSVGYGSRGTGSAGEAPKFYASRDRAAMRNVIDVVEAPVPSGRGGNSLGTDFDSEDGEHNALVGDETPVDRFEGALGSGDSGGSLWIRTARGWAIAGINVSGDDDQYGASNWYSRVSTQREWILRVFPGARFAGEQRCGDPASDPTELVTRRCAAPTPPR